MQDDLSTDIPQQTLSQDGKAGWECPDKQRVGSRNVNINFMKTKFYEAESAHITRTRRGKQGLFCIVDTLLGEFLVELFSSF